jgi:Na+/H+ antiporter NhaD/arsenite permease-like protein
VPELLSAVLEPGALITLVVLLGSIVLFITGWLAPEVTGLLALFALSAGLFRSGGLDRLRALIGSDAIRSPKRMIALMVAAVGPVSAFVPNTPIVASLLPVIESWCQRRRISPSKVLLPLSFATVLGGTMTLLGSSVNLPSVSSDSRRSASVSGWWGAW